MIVVIIGSREVKGVNVSIPADVVKDVSSVPVGGRGDESP